MAGLRSTVYEFTGATSEEIMSAMDEVLRPLYFRLSGLAEKDKWVSMDSDGYWRGFTRRDSCGLTLSLVYRIEDTDSESVQLLLVWDRYGILSKLYPTRDALSVVSTWQIALEDGFQNAGLRVRKVSEY